MSPTPPLSLLPSLKGDGNLEQEELLNTVSREYDFQGMQNSGLNDAVSLAEEDDHVMSVGKEKLTIKDLIVIMFVMLLWLYSIVLMFRAWNRILNFSDQSTSSQGSEKAAFLWRWVLDHITLAQRRKPDDLEEGEQLEGLEMPNEGAQDDSDMSGVCQKDIGREAVEGSASALISASDEQLEQHRAPVSLRRPLLRGCTIDSMRSSYSHSVGTLTSDEEILTIEPRHYLQQQLQNRLGATDTHSFRASKPVNNRQFSLQSPRFTSIDTCPEISITEEEDEDCDFITTV